MSTEFTQTETTGEFTGTESAEDFTGTETGSKPKKSSNKVIIVVALVAVVAVVGFYGMRIINAPSGSQAPPAPQLPPAEVADAPPPSIDGLDTTQDPMLQEPAQDVDPLSDLMGTDSSMMDPLAMDPSQPQAVDPLADLMGTDPSQPQVVEEYPTVDPLQQDAGMVDQGVVQQPMYEEGVPVSPDQMVQAQPVVQEPGLVVPAQPISDPALQSLMGIQDSQPAQVPAEPEVVPEPVQQEVVPVYTAAPAPSQQEGSLDIASIASVVGQAVSDALKPMEDRWNSRFDSLERRLSRVESRPRQEAAPARSTPARQSSTPTPRASISRVPQEPKRPANRIEVLDEPTPAPSPRPVVRQVESFSASSAPAVSSCSLGAVLEGRAWLKRGDGSFESYIVGDTLPDGKTITAITPEKGIVANGQSWSCK